AFPGFIMMLLLGGGVFDVPLSMPPLPEDPVISRAAPEECIWYLSLAGVAKPDKGSKNQTEQLLAEEEVQKFVTTVTEKVRAAIAKEAPRGQDAVLAVEGPKLVLALVTHPAAAFVSQVEIGPAGSDIKGGAIVSTGDDTPEISRSIAAIEAFLPKGLDAKPAAGKWRRLPSPPGAPVVEWGFDEKYFIVGVGEGSAEAISARRKTSGAAVNIRAKGSNWLMTVKKALPVERP